MRIGGFIFDSWQSPRQWAENALKMGYSAVYFPLDATASIKEIDQYTETAAEHDLLIAEIGVWNNTLDSDRRKRRIAVDRAVQQLELAEYTGARCCVNIAGSRGSQWDGPHKDNLTQETFDMVVNTTREIIDRVHPKRTFYTLEPMPWMFPNSAESYQQLLKAVDRPAFAVHMDPVNIISSPEKFYQNGAVISGWFDLLGPYIKSCHAKDIFLNNKLTVHLDECCPGSGELDYRTLLSRLQLLEPDTCLMLEHMDRKEGYIAGMNYLRSVMAAI